MPISTVRRRYAPRGRGHYPKTTLALLKLGHSEADIEKIWGGNTLRVLRAVEEVARKNRE